MSTVAISIARLTRRRKLRRSAPPSTPAPSSGSPSAARANNAQPLPPRLRRLSLDQFAAIYIERASQASGKASWKDDASLLATIRNFRTADGRRLGEWARSAITEDELEAFHAAQRAAGRAASTLNHLIQMLKAAFRWAVRKNYLTRSPISDDSALKRSKPTKRTRRLQPDEETAFSRRPAPDCSCLSSARSKRGCGSASCSPCPGAT